MKALRRGEEERLAAGRGRAEGLESGADVARERFDAAAAARETSEAAFADFRERMAEDVESFRGGQVGAGRLKTGPGQEDQDRLVRGFGRDLSREVSRGAFQAASLNLRNIEGRSGAAESARDRDLDFLGGATDREQARQNQRKQRRRGRFGALGGLAGAAVGSVGGPAGAALGARLGSAVGTSI
jgi:hypothetical protein